MMMSYRGEVTLQMIFKFPGIRIIRMKAAILDVVVAI